jgi:Putative Ig domain
MNSRSIPVRARLIFSALLVLLVLALAFGTGCSGSSSAKNTNPPVPVQFSGSTLPSTAVGSAYSATLKVTGGTAPYGFTVLSGALPSGLSLSSTTGAISGTPTASGQFSFTVQVSDSSTPPQTAQASFSLSVNPLDGVVISTAALPSGTVGIAYSTTLTATGGTAPYSWTVASGTLPAGLSLSKGGTISGTPTSAGQSNFTVQVTDSSSPVQNAIKPFSISISAAGLPLTITTASLPNATVETAYSTTLTATGGTTPYSWTLVSGTLPLGLSLSNGGTISGIPRSAGQSNFTVQVTDSSSPVQNATKPLSINTAAPPLTITTTSLPNGIVGIAYSSTLTATGGTTPYSWTIVSGTLPAGLSLSQGGTISGTPTSAGQSNFTVQVTDSSSPQQKANKPLSITISSGGSGSVQFYIVGNTTSASYPVTDGSMCEGCPAENGIFTMLNIDAAHTTTTASFSTYLGGAASPGVTQIRSMWVDPVTGDVFTGGRTSCELNSVNDGSGGEPCHFPITPGAFQTTYAGGADDAVICRWTSAGVNEWCSYLGTDGTQPEETVYGIAGLDNDGNLAVCGRMNSIPSQGTIDGVTWTKFGDTPLGNDVGYVAKIKPDGSALLWFTSFGGNGGGEGIRGRCTLDSSGNVYAGGESASSDFPVTAGVFGNTKHSANGVQSGIVVNVKSDGSAFNWATYISGSCNQGSPCSDNADGGIVLDSSNNVFVCGQTGSTDLLTQNGSPTGYQTTYESPAGDHSNSQYCFKIKSDGTSVLNGTFLGGNAGTFSLQANEANAVALDVSGNVVVLGETYDTNFPTTSGAYQTTLVGAKSLTLVKLSSDLTTLQAGTYMGGNNVTACDHSGGIGFDSMGNIYASCGGTTSTNFPVTSDAYQSGYIGDGSSRDMVLFGVNSSMTSLVYGTYLGTLVNSGDTDGTFGWAFAMASNH